MKEKCAVEIKKILIIAFEVGHARYTLHHHGWFFIQPQNAPLLFQFSALTCCVGLIELLKGIETQNIKR